MWQCWHDADTRLYNADEKIIAACRNISKASEIFRSYCTINGNTLDDGKLNAVSNKLWDQFSVFEKEVRPYIWDEQNKC